MTRAFYVQRNGLWYAPHHEHQRYSDNPSGPICQDIESFGLLHTAEQVDTMKEALNRCLPEDLSTVPLVEVERLQNGLWIKWVEYDAEMDEMLPIAYSVDLV